MLLYTTLKGAKVHGPLILWVCLNIVYYWKLKTENWKYCSKIIFKCVNSAVRLNFKVDFTKIRTCESREQCTGFTQINANMLWDYYPNLAYISPNINIYYNSIMGECKIWSLDIFIENNKKYQLGYEVPNFSPLVVKHRKWNRFRHVL